MLKKTYIHDSKRYQMVKFKIGSSSQLFLLQSSLYSHSNLESQPSNHPLFNKQQVDIKRCFLVLTVLSEIICKHSNNRLWIRSQSSGIGQKLIVMAATFIFYAVKLINWGLRNKELIRNLTRRKWPKNSRTISSISKIHGSKVLFQ